MKSSRLCKGTKADKKAFWRNSMKKIRKIIAVIITLSLILSLSINVAATQSHGETINGVRYNCSLVRNQTSATAVTSCTGSGAACGVTLTLRYYNNGSIIPLTKYSTGTGIQTASTYVNGAGNDVATLSAASQHTVYYGNLTWTYALTE